MRATLRTPRTVAFWRGVEPGLPARDPCGTFAPPWRSTHSRWTVVGCSSAGDDLSALTRGCRRRRAARTPTSRRAPSTSPSCGRRSRPGSTSRRSERIVIAVKNTGHKAVPNVAVTVDSFAAQVPSSPICRSVARGVDRRPEPAPRRRTAPTSTRGRSLAPSPDAPLRAAHVTAEAGDAYVKWRSRRASTARPRRRCRATASAGSAPRSTSPDNVGAGGGRCRRPGRSSARAATAAGPTNRSSRKGVCPPP